MKVNVEKQPKSTIKLTVTLPPTKIKEAYNQVLDEAVENTELQGFRKGKAPRDLVEEKVGTSKLQGDTINKLLQTYYPQAVKENHISAISNPKVEIKEFDMDKDFEFTATIATKPQVKIDDFKPKLKERFKVRLESAKKELSETNKEKLAKGEKLEEPHVHLGTHDVLDIVTSSAKVEIPELLVDEEVDRMMARLLDQTQNLGMTIEQYLKAQNKSAEQVREEYIQVSERNIKAEFVLGHLVQEEKIEVTDDEIDEAYKAAGVEDSEAKMHDPVERVYVKSVLQKNKLLSKLIEEAEGEHHHEH